MENLISYLSGKTYLWYTRVSHPGYWRHRFRRLRTFLYTKHGLQLIGRLCLFVAWLLIFSVILLSF